jgi:hypothetical protein
MSLHFPHSNLTVGVLGGTFFSSLVNIGTQDYIATIVLAILGAVVSFIASVVMKILLKSIKKQRKK